MKFNSENVSSFFGKSKVMYTIPAYQRAYSWDEGQLSTFFEDLIDHKGASQQNPYCYGNILLETVLEGRHYEIIDGQQRLTTVSLFLRSLLNEIAKRIKSESVFARANGEIIVIQDEEDIFFKDHGVIKLRPTDYDRGCYDTLVIENKNEYNCSTPSQKRMLFAKKYFDGRLCQLGDDELISILETTENAIINRIELSGKKESALMFELQNNRGKGLTNLEKLKSFLMYQLYVYSQQDETETNIEYVSKHFNVVYNIVNQLNQQLGSGDDENANGNINEDNILLYHSYAYSKKNFGYRNLNDIIEEFKEIPQNEKVKWIKDYSLALYESFSNINKFLFLNDVSRTKLEKLGVPYFVYPFILKGFRYCPSEMSKLLSVMEVLSFRYKLVNSRADIRGRLNDLIRNFTGNVTQLKQDMCTKMNEAYYWGDKKILEVLNGDMYRNGVIKYFLWEYEQSLQQKGYTITGQIKIEDESIEHISPRHEDTEKPCSGYEVDNNGEYSLSFRENYINKLGNLMLISRSHNSSIGNKPFKEKLSSYNRLPLLLQQAQIKDYIQDQIQPVWKSTEIDKRHKNMIQFALVRWAFI